jgi:hypothetical protein
MIEEAIRIQAHDCAPRLANNSLRGSERVD